MIFSFADGNQWNELMGLLVHEEHKLMSTLDREEMSVCEVMPLNTVPH